MNKKIIIIIIISLVLQNKLLSFSGELIENPQAQTYREELQNILNNAELNEIYSYYSRQHNAPTVSKNKICSDNISDIDSFECLITNLDKICISKEYKILCNAGLEDLELIINRDGSFDSHSYNNINDFKLLQKDVFIDKTNKKKYIRYYISNEAYYTSTSAIYIYILLEKLKDTNTYKLLQVGSGYMPGKEYFNNNPNEKPYYVNPDIE